ncbi:Spermidine N(1)-acetyltransferase [Cedecea lapagei]|uniref:Spermidine N(1)-acetyltransferase n=1 Tax=Cedecea lapagei TaxID=158823 RepID=A0A3S4IE64_9ENTR|nr:GNAT family N-acetyltransferase [Cedecea lapagei]VEB97628.1 Spermidine N(1)-acetyltransferase [Cedecea lapagei]
MQTFLYTAQTLHQADSTNPFNVVIETPRLKLSPPTEADASALLSIFSDPQVMQYWNTAPWQSLDEAKGFITRSEEEMRDGKTLTLCIHDKESGQLAGKCMLFSFAGPSRRAEIGFGLGREYWGKGLVNEAAGALIAYGFQALGLRRIEAEIDPDNQASAAALKKLGFLQEGLLRQRWEINGVISDSALFGLLAEDKKPA